MKIIVNNKRQQQKKNQIRGNNLRMREKQRQFVREKEKKKKKENLLNSVVCLKFVSVVNFSFLLFFFYCRFSYMTFWLVLLTVLHVGDILATN